MSIKLYSYWRSSAAYRVRIALNLKGVSYQTISVSLAADSENRGPAYRAINPQMMVPYFDDGRVAIGQSQAILEYLEEAYPEPRLLPETAAGRARVRAFCNIICCDIHPLNNLRVLKYLKHNLQVSDDQRSEWYAHWIAEGFAAAEAVLERHDAAGPYAFGSAVTLADICLVPQIYNARRFNVLLDDYPRLVSVADACEAVPAFQNAAPEQQPDADV